jgi:HPt (histidine-containing phosphotransfer) domain-containing protein
MSGPSEPDPGEAQLREQVKVLGEKFLIRTAGQIVTLREQVLRLDGHPEALAVIQEITHKIHGSGAMFGFAALSERAGEIERLLVAGESVTPEQLSGLIEQLAAALEETQRQN